MKYYKKWKRVGHKVMQLNFFKPTKQYKPFNTSLKIIKKCNNDEIMYPEKRPAR